MDLDELRSAQSRERQASQLQHLRDGFYEEAAEFIRGLRADRRAVAERSEHAFPSDDPDVRRLTDEIETAEDVVESLYERRVGKVVKMASFAAADMNVDDDGLTNEEADLFETLVDDIEASRATVLDALAGEGPVGGPGASPAGGRSDSPAGTTTETETSPTADATRGRVEEADAASDRAPPTGADGEETTYRIGEGPATDGPVSTADGADGAPEGAPEPTPTPGAEGDPVRETAPPDGPPPVESGERSGGDGMDAASAMGGTEADAGRSGEVPGGVPDGDGRPANADASAATEAPAGTGADQPTDAGRSADAGAAGPGVDTGRPEQSTAGTDHQPVPPAEGPPGAEPPTPETGAADPGGGSASPTEDSQGADRTAGATEEDSETHGTLVRVTADVGEIFGVDGRSYDLAAGDVAVLPADNASVLVDDGDAERLQSAVPFSPNRS
jgi:DNA replication factor GINS